MAHPLDRGGLGRPVTRRPWRRGERGPSAVGAGSASAQAARSTLVVFTLCYADRSERAADLGQRTEGSLRGKSPQAPRLGPHHSGPPARPTRPRAGPAARRALAGSARVSVEGAGTGEHHKQRQQDDDATPSGRTRIRRQRRPNKRFKAAAIRPLVDARAHRVLPLSLRILLGPHSPTLA